MEINMIILKYNILTVKLKYVLSVQNMENSGKHPINI